MEILCLFANASSNGLVNGVPDNQKDKFKLFSSNQILSYLFEHLT
jgi:hypothetical protein